MRNTRTPAEWRSLFDEQFRSGLNKTQFCRLHGITRSAFSNAWLRLSASDASHTLRFRTPSQDRRKQARASQCNPACGECYLSSARKPAAHPHLTQRHPLPARRYPATLVGYPAAGDGTMKMFVEPPAIWLYPGHIDFRKSINGLVLIIEQGAVHSPFDEALFVFCNRTRDKVKALYWDKTGFCLWYKRLEKDFFRWPKVGQETMPLTEEQWRWLLAGIDLDKIRTHQPLDCTLTS